MSSFEEELRTLLNRHSKDSASNTPDFILAKFLTGCLENFNSIILSRTKWYNSWYKNEIVDSHRALHSLPEQKIPIEKETNMNGVRIISPVLNRQQRKPPVKESASPRVDDTVEGQYDKAGKANKGPTKLPPKSAKPSVPAVVKKKNPMEGMVRHNIQTKKIT